MDTGSKDGHSDHHSHHFDGTHYVVSQDIDLLVERWCNNSHLAPPSDSFYLELRSSLKDFLKNIFANVTIVASEEIRSGLLESAIKYEQAGLTVVSLERAYLEDGEVGGRIELTRTVDEDGDDIIIPSPRFGTPDKRSQFERLRGKNIALFDDVIFSGRTLIETISALHQYHVNVHAVTVAVGVKDGVDKLRNAGFCVSGMPKQLNIECLDEFDDVSDQVCERDFYPGIPYSGRQYFCDDTAFPYLLPFGRPDKWASIPEKELKKFSALCIDNTISLFEEIERINGTIIPCSAVPRPVYGFPKNGTRFVDLLAEARVKMLRA